MSTKSKKTTADETVNAPEAQAPEQPQRFFLLSEEAINVLFGQFQELPFKVANPLIQYLQKNLQEVKPDQIKEEGK